jgi:hypothetical protein
VLAYITTLYVLFAAIVNPVEFVELDVLEFVVFETLDELLVLF